MAMATGTEMGDICRYNLAGQNGSGTGFIFIPLVISCQILNIIDNFTVIGQIFAFSF